jgi:thiamine-phosphate pyrophosphorylase
LPTSIEIRATKLPAKRPLYYYITDRKKLAGISLMQSIRRAISWGADFIQIREKDLSDRELFELVREAVVCCRESESRILVNGRADIAMAAGAQGVHLPSTGLKIPDLSRWLPARFVVGVSVHSVREACLAAKQGADYLLFGPIFRTPSKVGLGTPLGLPSLRNACLRVPVPIFGLGGIDAARIPEVLQSGAAGISGISLFQRDFAQLPAGDQQIRPVSQQATGKQRNKGVCSNDANLRRKSHR